MWPWALHYGSRSWKRRRAEGQSTGSENEYVVPTPSGVSVTRYQRFTCILGLSKIGLAIIVWHFFFVIFHPEEYPMSWTWITGKTTKKFAKDHHAQWYEDEIEPLGDDEEDR